MDHPPDLFSEPGIATREDVNICYESPRAIFRLMRTFSRYYVYAHLSMDFVHTLSTVASSLLMKQYLENTPWDEANMSKSLCLILEAMSTIKDTHPCIEEIEKSIIHATQAQSTRVRPLSDSGLID